MNNVSRLVDSRGTWTADADHCIDGDDDNTVYVRILALVMDCHPYCDTDYRAKEAALRKQSGRRLLAVNRDDSDGFSNS